MTRDEMIDWLVDELLDAIREDVAQGDYSMIADYLRDGFCGFEKYSDEELKEEYEERVYIKRYIEEARS